jgi:hypothetical protein
MAGSIYLADYIADYVARIITIHTAHAGNHPNGAFVVPPGVALFHFSYI